jgi:hypothetical protein
VRVVQRQVGNFLADHATRAACGWRRCSKARFRCDDGIEENRRRSDRDGAARLKGWTRAGLYLRLTDRAFTRLAPGQARVTRGTFSIRTFKPALGHQQRSDNVPAWSGQPHKADLSKNSPSMLPVPQAKPSPDYEYRISLRPHAVGHPSSSTRDSASRAVPSSIRVRRDGYREAGEWQQAECDQRGRAAQKVFARSGSRKPRSDQHQECSTTDNHG